MTTVNKIKTSIKLVGALLFIWAMTFACKEDYVTGMLDSMPEDVYMRIKEDNPHASLAQIIEIYVSDGERIESELNAEYEYALLHY